MDDVQIGGLNAMDDHRFDELSKRFAGKVTRRQVMRKLGTGLAGGLMAAAGLRAARQADAATLQDSALEGTTIAGGSLTSDLTVSPDLTPIKPARSAGCKQCLQACRNQFGLAGAIPPPEAGACREFCLALGGCTFCDFEFCVDG
jgi:hypothetical protein